MPGMVTCTVNNALTTDQFVDVQNMYTNRRQYFLTRYSQIMDYCINIITIM